ncbi:hypothetical protein [Achromobacter phage ewik_TL4]|nr:hypothetical protein [Achromobacter phage hasilly_LB3]WNO48766.1 hypothetical protein [Achromobacter phage nyaak_TL1]WNO48832.1 hypothetical protein [Achromobacter phage maay_LB1]WNO48895.1 hypothetical protein [Achromobacter phage kuwaak_TL2]WNO48960.1 hypothetical protein [Achromobacter phage ewii_LB8]WNO49024.1 hypothetical protein [Achromobacter phage emuu_LB7]WNO49090.1 hypothetical protein [Achromobacter phage ehaak_LB5]WNO49240.1 hypothetical protein [Achromobacter phage ewik_TL4]
MVRRQLLFTGFLLRRLDYNRFFVDNLQGAHTHGYS